MKNLFKKVFKWIIPYQMYNILKKLYLRKTWNRRGRTGGGGALDISKYGKYRPAGGMGDKMQMYINYVKEDTNIKAGNIFEIGANFAQDADYLMEQFGLMPSDIYVFEAHPEIYAAIKEIHDFNAFNVAVFDLDKEVEFNTYPLDHIDTGWSSIFHNGGKKIKIEAIRMDNFMLKNNIKEIDFLKIDVEGGTYQVLNGFGERLKDIKCIQLEAEHNRFAIISYEEISELLLKNGFELVHFFRNNRMRQSDSFWIKKECIVYPTENNGEDAESTLTREMESRKGS